MIILVDGPDGTGKTGYSKYLAREYGFPRLEMGPVDTLDCIEQKSAVFNDTLVQLDEQDVNAVVDRGPVSSLVYSKVEGRSPTTSNAQDTIESIDPVIVWLDCDPDELLARYSDDLYSDLELREVVEEYKTVMESLESDGYDVVRIDTTAGVVDKLQGEISERIHGSP